MKTKTIAKIQVIFGIVFLLISLIGFISLGVIQDDKEKLLSNLWSSATDGIRQYKYMNFSNESIVSLSEGFLSQYYILNNQYTNIFFSTLLTSIILLAISLFFITQGMVNLKEKKK